MGVIVVSLGVGLMTKLDEVWVERRTVNEFCRHTAV